MKLDATEVELLCNWFMSIYVRWSMPAEGVNFRWAMLTKEDRELYERLCEELEALQEPSC